MKRKILSTLALSAILFAGCQKEDVGAPYNGEVHLTSDIKLTRASGTQWAQNDKVGIFMLNYDDKATLSENIQYNNENVNGASATFKVVTDDETIYYPQSGTVDLFGYYPYKAEVTSNIYNVDVTTQDPLTTIDLMVSEKIENVTKTKSAQNLNFKHKLSNIVLNITAGSGVTPTDISGITSTIAGTYPTASYDVKANNGFTNIAGTVADIAMVVTNSGTRAEALVIPQATTTGVKFKFAIPNVGYFEAVLPADLDPNENGSQVTLLSGSKYIFAVTINRTEAGLGAEITDWRTVNGGDINGDEVLPPPAI